MGQEVVDEFNLPARAGSWDVPTANARRVSRGLLGTLISAPPVQNGSGFSGLVMSMHLLLSCAMTHRLTIPNGEAALQEVPRDEDGPELSFVTLEGTSQEDRSLFFYTPYLSDCRTLSLICKRFTKCNKVP